MPLLQKFVKFNATLLVGGASFTAYQYPELRSNPRQMCSAMVRGGRCAVTGCLMAKDYLMAREIGPETHKVASQRLYMCLRANAGVYIKLGQMVGQLDQLIPPEYVVAFQPMLMYAPKTPFEDVRAIVEADLGGKLEDHYSEFEEKPIASASLGQVHKAKLRSTGETVAVKVQHMWIRQQCAGDIRLIQFFSDCACAIFPEYKYGWLAEETRVKLPLELDFRREAQNALRCKQIFEKNPHVAVPSIFEDLTSERVLTMSFETGIPASSVKEMHAQGINLKRCARLISETFNQMIYEEGFVHSDPHPGNIFVRKTKINGQDDLQVVLLDHGIYTDLRKETRLSYTKLWRGVLTQNEDKIKEASKELGADFYQMMVGIVVNRTWEDIMDEKKKVHLKARLGERQDAESQEQLKEHAMTFHKEIVEVLDQMHRELLLILKTNNYLRAIDKRLGNPTNTYNIINNVTWRIYCREVAFKAEQTGKWQFAMDCYRYYIIKLIFCLNFFRVRMLSMIGIKASKEELEDFELDYVQ